MRSVSRFVVAAQRAKKVASLLRPLKLFWKKAIKLHPSLNSDTMLRMRAIMMSSQLNILDNRTLSSASKVPSDPLEKSPFHLPLFLVDPFFKGSQFRAAALENFPLLFTPFIWELLWRSLIFITLFSVISFSLPETKNVSQIRVLDPLENCRLSFHNTIRLWTSICSSC